MADRTAFLKSLDLLKGSGDLSYSPTTYTPNTIQFQRPTIAPVDLSAGKIDYNSLPSLTKSSGGGNGKPWWMDTLNAYQGIFGSIIDPLVRATDGNDDTKWYDHFSNIKEGYAQSWNDGKLNMGDVFGGLMYAGENSKTGSDLLTNMGWEEGEKTGEHKWNPFVAEKGKLDLHDIAGLGIDIFTDPLTFLTGGASSALKAGAKAGKSAAKDVVQQELVQQGVNIGSKQMNQLINPKNWEELVKQVADQRFAKHVANGADEDIIATSRKSFEENLLNQLNNTSRQARNTAQNKMFNFDIPFTNVTKGFGNKPSFLQVNDIPIGSVGAGRVQDILTSKGVDDVSEQLKIIQNGYGVGRIEDMTKQMLEHFNNTVKNLPSKTTEDFAELFGRTSGYVPNPSPVKGRKQLEDWFIQNSNDLFGFQVDRKTLKNFPFKTLKQTADDWTHIASPVKYDQFGKSAPVQTSKLTTNTGEAIKTELQFKRFVQDMGGKSKVSSLIGDGLLKLINPRSLGTGDNLVNEAAGNIRDAENFMRGNYAQMKREMNSIDKSAKGLTKEEMEHIPYIIEGKFPKGQSKSDYMSANNVSPASLQQLEEVAQKMRNLFDKFRQREQGVGALGRSRQNYFPHMTVEGMDEEALMKFINDPDVQKWLGRSSSNRFNRERTGFQTMADWKDALDELEHVRSGLSSADEIEEITEKINQLRQLMDTDAVNVLSRRYRANIRITAMKEMQNHFEDMGYLISPVHARNRPQSNDFKFVDEEMAKNLGIPKGSYIHKEVVDAIKKTEDMFTDKGMQHVLNELTSATNIWKTFVTTIVPSHHAYNFIGNIANNSMAGVTLKNYRQAGKLLKAMKEGTLTPKQEKIIQAAYDKGVIAGGSMIDNSDPLWKNQLEKQGRFGKTEVKLNENVFIRGGRAVGDSIDDYTRLALFTKGLEQTGSSKHAADLVRRYLFNYGEMTQADRALKIMMPFWNWTRHNLPLQLTEFARQPRYYQTFMNFQQAIQDGRDGSNDPNFTDDWLSPGGKFINPRLPLQDLTRMGTGWGMIAGNMTPFAKWPLELEINKQFFNQQPIEYGKDPEANYSGDALAEYWSNQIGLPGKMYKYNTNDSNGFMDSLDLLFGYRNYNFDQTGR